MAFGNRLKNAWNAFVGKDAAPPKWGSSFGSGNRPDRRRFVSNNLRTILSAVYNRIAVDCSMMNVQHVRLDQNGRYKTTMNSTLNRALTTEANVDQTGRELIREAVTLMLDEGCVAIAPVSTDTKPGINGMYKIYELRVGKVKEWFPREVLLELYDEDVGEKKEIKMSKSFVSIVENPFYGIMNEPNSVGQRYVRVLNQLDRANENCSADRLDMIIQLPYTIKTDARRKMAEERRNDIEQQLSGSTRGIAYTDATERIVQLNRPLENNLWNQAKELQDLLFNQIGFSKAILDGTADEAVMLNYVNSIIEPILTAITEEMQRKWISQTAQTQGQAIRFFEDPFRLVPVAQLAEIADKFTRNEILTSNEVRSIVGMKPVDDPKADALRNSNLNHPDEVVEETEETEEDVEIQNEEEGEDEV